MALPEQRAEIGLPRRTEAKHAAGMNPVRPHYVPAPYQDSAGEGRVILRDGSTAQVRFARADDRPAMAAFFRRLSPASRRFRFFTETKPGPDLIERLCGVTNPLEQVTLVVLRTLDGIPQIIASASYIRLKEHEAEFAVAVDDSFHGKGLGGLLLERLATIAASHGFTEFVAVTHPDNRPMLDVFRHSGLEPKETFSEGLVEITFSLRPRAESVERSEARDQLYTKASIRPLFRPSSIAVLGATREPGGFGQRILQSLLANGFQGPVYPVNPKATEIAGVRAYPTVADIPEAVDLAILAVPAEVVKESVDACAAKGVRALIVISSGFADAGPEGVKQQQALVAQVRGHGMRLLGPNCLGVMNTDPDVSLNATFVDAMPPRGHVALSSQSGALGLAMLHLARRRGLGLSMFASMGNKADVTGNDLLLAWEDDPDTSVILLYLESFGNPRRFSRIARKVGRSKPIVCVKSGRSDVGDLAVEALFRQAGVIRADSIEDMFDTAVLLGTQPLPRGRRVAIATNSHGAGVLCRDACIAAGLDPQPPSAPAVIRLRDLLPAGADVSRVVDLTASASTEHYYQAAEAMLWDPSVDSLIAIYIPVLDNDGSKILHALASGIAAARRRGAPAKPVLVVMMSGEGERLVARAGEESIPRFLFPETAARALGRAADYAAWRGEPAGVVVDFEDMDLAQARATCREAAARSAEGWLTSADAASALSAAGIRVGDTASPLPLGSIPMFLRVREDPSFGPILTLGIVPPDGGEAHDIAHRLIPLTDHDATAMLSSLRAYRRLSGTGGRPACDIDALRDVLLRVSLLVEDIGEIRELEFNPILICPAGEGCRILSARVCIHTNTP